MLLSEAIESLCIATRADGRSVRTVQSYRQKLAPLLGFLGAVYVEEITVGDLRRYVASQLDLTSRYEDHPTHRAKAGGLSPFTIASRVRAVRRLFNFLEDEEIIGKNPAKRVKVPRPKREKPKGVVLEDVVALLKTTAAGNVIDLRDRALILFLTDTGCRAGGLCGLQIQDLDLAAQRAIVREKQGKSRFVFFEPETAKALAAWLAVRPQDKGPWVFVGLGMHSKGGVSANTVLQMLRKRAKLAGVTGPVNPHAFRHGFARHFLLDGGDLATLSRLLGHSDSKITTDYYAIFTTDELQEKHRKHSPVTRMFGGDKDVDL
jgi:site-specific recombinase XerD